MMIEYRKAGLRTFYRIDGTEVLRVRNMLCQSEVLTSRNNFIIASDAVDETKVITEQEFNEQFDLAMERIKNGVV